MKKNNLVILISGRGSNMQAIVEANLPNVDTVAVISNNPNAEGLNWAASKGIETVVIDNKGYSSREDFDSKMVEMIDSYNPDLIVLAGFMRILTSKFCETYKNRLINIHPSLLPSFQGLNTHERAINSGCKFAGCTVHFVTPELDCGPIISQGIVTIEDSDTPETIASKVLRIEHQLLPEAIQNFFLGNLEISGNRVFNTKSMNSNS